jgi:two-component system sensor histidine kinase CreC
MRGETPAGVLTVAKPADSVNRFVERAEKKIISGAIAACGAAILLGALLSMWVTAPVKRLTDYARAVRDNRPVSAPRTGKGELAIMGKAMEQMRESLEGKRYVEQYVQTLTHELKSPLSAIRGAAELLREEMPAEQRATFTDNIREESARMQGIMDRMLQLSSLEKRRALRDIETVELATLLDEVAASTAPQFEHAGVELHADTPDALHVRGERFLLRQALTNLVQNALDFSRPDTSVRLRAERRRNMVTVIVEDSGPGIPDYALDKVYDRFFSLPRPASGRKSSGLGLSLVRQVAELHEGSVSLANRPEGGARAELVLPLADA